MKIKGIGPVQFLAQYDRFFIAQRGCFATSKIKLTWYKVELVMLIGIKMN